MCHKGCHHTIMDPKRNAGTCSKEECPMCKPKSCCGKHHKHYVYNTESMEGVCVRHNDDCTAVCVPQKPDPTKKRVCSKGCNRMLKVAKAKPKPSASTDAALFDIVVCQVDHHIVCDAWSKHGSKKERKSPCRTTKWVKPVARCVDFDAGVWNAGPTCMANAANAAPTPAPTPPPTPPPTSGCVDKMKGSQCGQWNAKGYCRKGHRHYAYATKRCCKTCPKKSQKKKTKPKAVLGCAGVASAAITKIKKLCKLATIADNIACKPFAESLAEYY